MDQICINLVKNMFYFVCGKIGIKSWSETKDEGSHRFRNLVDLVHLTRKIRFSIYF